MASLSSVLKLTLLDGVSGPIRKVNGAISSLNRQTAYMMTPLRGMTGQILAFGGAYLGVTEGWSRTYGAASQAQSALSEIGIKADLTQTQLGVLQKRLVDLSPKVNQSTADLMAGVDAMLTMGTAAKDAEGAIPAIGKAATATGASISDLSSASSSAMQNLGVLPVEIGRMLDGMAYSANAGAFEMKDMASFFPQLTASAQTLGIHGVEGVNDLAAALQIARRGAGDASTASNNLSDFMGKIVTPQTIKNFRKFGVDVTKELAKVKKSGISPIEHFIGLLDKKTQGGKGELLTQIFGDKQTLDFIRPMIAGFDDYIRIRNEANKANGTVADAYARRMEDANQKVKAFQISMENLGTSIGANLLGPVGEMAEDLAKVLGSLDSRFTVFDEFKSRFSGLLSGLGMGDGTDALKGIRDLIFGAEDASGAADKYGRLFGQFQEYGKSLREFGKEIKDNPVAKFLSDLSPHYVSVLKWSAGFMLLAGAIRKFAAAMMLISGASMMLGMLKGLGGLLTDMADFPGLPDGKNPKKTPSSGGNGLPDVIPWLSRVGTWFKGLGVNASIGAVPQILSDTPGDSHDDQVRNQAKFKSFLESIFGRVGDTNTSHPYLSRDYDDGGRAASQDAYLGENGTKNVPSMPAGWPSIFDKKWWFGAAADTNFNSRQHFGVETKAGGEAGGSPRTTGEMLAGLNKPITLDAGTIGQLLQPSRGVQEVREVNRQPPEIKISNVFNITEASSGKGVAAEVMADIGGTVKNAVEAADTD